LAAVGLANTVVLTVEVLVGQVPFDVVQRKTYVPGTRPVMIELLELGAKIPAVLGPESCVHKPEPTEVAEAAIVATVSQTVVMGGPALEVVGGINTLIET
jgi:hypothetical protein